MRMQEMGDWEVTMGYGDATGDGGFSWLKLNVVWESVCARNEDLGTDTVFLALLVQRYKVNMHR